MSKKHLLLLFGLAFFWVRLLFTSFCSPLFSSNENYQQTVIVAIINSSNLVAMIAALAFAKRLREFSQHPTLVVGLSGLAALGLGLAFIGLTDMRYLEIGMLGGALVGIGGGVLPLQWCEATDVVSSRFSLRLSCMVASCAAALIFLVSVSLPTPAMIALVAASPLASSCLLLRAYRETPVEERRRTQAIERDIAVDRPALPYPLLLFLITLSMALSVMRTNYLPTKGLPTSEWSLIMSACVLLVLAIVAIAYRLERRLTASTGDAAFPLIVLLFIAAPHFTGSHPLVSNVLIISGLLLAWSLIYSELDLVTSPAFTQAQLMAMGVICLRIGAYGGMIVGIAFEDAPDKWLVGLCLSALCLLAWALRRIRKADVPERLFSPEQKALMAREAAEAARVETLEQRYLEQCNTAGEQYGLSKKEREVLWYLVRGYTAKTISQKLYVSKNTIKTHIAHIYKKTDVHTRDGLRFLVEAAATEAFPPC